MLARLIMALLLAAFAVPAAAPAACHDASMSTAHDASMTMAMTTKGESAEAVPATPDRTALPIHGCIGCIPPSTWIAARIASVAPAEAAMPVARVAVLDIGTDAAPALRPPRTA